MCGTRSNQYITLRVDLVERKFYSFWLKDVRDVDLSKHCIKCLKGHRYMDITQDEGCTLALDKENVYYLCGVTYPYVWEKNFHLAFRYKEGHDFTFVDKGVHLTLKNAERIVFGEEDIDWSLPQSQDRKFSTCRNWQFANYFEHKLKGMVYNKDMKNQQLSFWHCYLPHESR